MKKPKPFGPFTAQTKKQPYEVAQDFIEAGGGNIMETDPRIRDYLQTGGINLDPVTQAWCAQFVNATLAQAGVKGSGKPTARSFLKYGEEVLQPRKGDIAVFKRSGDRPEDAGLGHAGFYLGQRYPGYIETIGGNQGDAANITQIEQDRVLGFRRPPGTPPPPPDAQSLTATVPPEVARGVFGTDLSRNLNPPTTVRGLPNDLGGTITPNLEAMYWQAVNMPRLRAIALNPDASLPTTEIVTSLWPRRRR